jgi:PAS domain S-box-containing protein
MLSVLYVDDEEALLDITRIFLERSGELKIDTCSNPNDALDMLGTRTFDVIVSDYEMPDLNGIDLLKSIKSRGLDIPFIIFTGRGREIVAIEALNNGAAFYLQKGGDPKAQFAELKNMIRRAAEHKQVERRLNLTQFSVDRASDEVFWIDPSGKFLFVNNAACKSKGYTQAELLSMTIFDINPGYTPLSWSERFRENKIKGSMSYESTHKRKDGSVFPVEITSNYLTFDGNEYFFAFACDISERKQNESELRASNEQMAAMIEQIRTSDESIANQFRELERQKQTLFESESRYQEIFDNAPLGIFNSTPEGKFLRVNHEFARILGYDSAEEIIGVVNRSTVQEALYENPYLHAEFVRNTTNSGKWQHFENRYRKKDGTVITGRLIFRSFINSKNGCRELEGFLEDISTQRKRDIEKIKETAARLETILHVATKLNNILDPAEVMHCICEEIAKSLDAPVVSLYIFDATRKVFVPTADYGILPEFRKFQSVIPHSFYKKIFSDEKRVTVLPDVQQMPYLPGLETDRSAGTRTVLAAIIERKGDLMGMLTVVTLGNTRTFKDADQSLVKGLADQTALALSNARLFAAQRNSEEAVLKTNKKLNILSNITRHDILNKLTVLQAYMDLMKERVTDPKMDMYIQAQEKAALAIAQQIDFTKTYQDLGVRQPEWQDINQVIRKNREQIDLKGIQFESNLKEVSLYADPLIEKVFYNLLDNSIRYGEKITHISISSKQETSGFTLIYEDDGIGIPDKDKKHIFERGVGKNTGLGLFLAREILSITGMTIEETGTSGKGVRFEIHVPASDIRVQSFTN